MEIVSESDSDELVVFVDMAIDNKQAPELAMPEPDSGTAKDLIEMLSESDSDESVDMIIDNVSSSAAPSRPPIISIPRYLDGTLPDDVLEVFGRTVSAIPWGSGRALSTSRLARTCRSWRRATRSSAPSSNAVPNYWSRRRHARCTQDCKGFGM